MTPFETDIAKGPLTAGSFLVALPSLHDPNFQNTVVLLCEVATHGTMGLVINRPTTLQLSTALPDETLLAGRDVPIFFGGPVQTERILILQRGGVGGADFHPVFAGISMGGTMDALKEAATGLGIVGEFRPYRGYSGWGAGQLEQEIEEGAWAVLPGDEDAVFSRTPGMLWAGIMKRLGGPFALYASMPADPSLN